jgi:hypothetical protein
MLYEEDDRVKQNELEKNQRLNQYNDIYDKLISDNKDITKQNEAYLDDYLQKNTDLANRTTDYKVDLLNQQQKQVEKSYQNETKQINADYKKSINPYGYDAEAMASSGLLNSSYAESVNVNKYAKTQQNLASTRANFEKQFQDFENQKSKARLENDSTIAQYSLEVLKQKLDAQLQEFQYNSDLTLNKLSNEQNIDNDYYSRYMDIVNQINYEKQQQESKRQYDEQMKYQKEQDRVSNALKEKYYQLQKRYS